MEPKDLVSEKLITLVPPDWWTSEEGYGFLKRQELKQEWVKLLNQLGCDVWFTLTFRKGASSAMLAVDRTKRLLKKACKSVNLDCNAFVVAEQHLSGTYHSHGMMVIGALSEEFETMFMRHFWKMAFEAHGRNSFTRISDGEAVGYYVAKYLTKSLADHQFIGFKGFRLK
ncbi:MAG: hypothetical protein HZB51_14585 [Chloroflexi bacterium]|nr:hypothetical protein [Chloroflexota bacterium]